MSDAKGRRGKHVAPPDLPDPDGPPVYTRFYDWIDDHEGGQLWAAFVWMPFVGLWFIGTGIAQGDPQTVLGGLAFVGFSAPWVRRRIRRRDRRL